MTQSELLTVIIVSLLFVLLPAPGLMGMFKKAGIPSWKAFIPYYNTYVMLQIAERPKHWFFWQFIPVVGWFITMGIQIEFVKAFGKYRFYQATLAALVPVFYFPFIGFNKEDRFVGVEAAKKYKKSSLREWVDAGIFAIVAATLIRTFVFEAYTIPTGSMEKTLLVNDFLFVSKSSYGPRIPNTPLAVPFVHHTLPIFGTQSYTELLSLPYTRWFATPVKRNDVVVFNFPAGDTLTKERDSEEPYYDIVDARQREFEKELAPQYSDPAALKAAAYEKARAFVWDNYTVTTRPVDKRENYIKRCVAVSGDVIQIKNGIVFINGKKAFLSPTSSSHHWVRTNNKVLTVEELREAGIMIKDTDSDSDLLGGDNFTYLVNLTEEEVNIIKTIPGVVDVVRQIEEPDFKIFPRDTTVANWSADNFGPLWIPKKGVTIPLTKQNIAFYTRAIKNYEGNTLEVKNGKVYLNGVEANSYTFKMDYFWMMGDNRHRSQDSRYWGYVPEDHIVGKASLIWMSWDKGLRWRRLFNLIK